MYDDMDSNGHAVLTTLVISLFLFLSRYIFLQSSQNVDIL